MSSLKLIFSFMSTIPEWPTCDSNDCRQSSYQYSGICEFGMRHGVPTMPQRTTTHLDETGIIHLHQIKPFVLGSQVPSTSPQAPTCSLRHFPRAARSISSSGVNIWGELATTYLKHADMLHHHIIAFSVDRADATIV